MAESIYHNHHIIPRHAGGTDDPSNLMKLTVEEHAEAHRRLWEEHGRLGDKAAWEMLSGQIAYGLETLREIYRAGGRMSHGRRHTQETKDKISVKIRGNKRPDFAEYCRKRRGIKLPPQSPEWIAKRAEAQRLFYLTPAGIAKRKAASDRMRRNNPGHLPGKKHGGRPKQA